MEQMTDTIMDYLITGIGTILGALIVYLIVILRGLIIEKIGETQFQRLHELVTAVVRAVEQEGKVYGWDGDNKFERAMVQIYNLRDTTGIKAKDDQIRMLVESAVQVVNSDKLQYAVIEEPREI